MDQTSTTNPLTAPSTESSWLESERLAWANIVRDGVADFTLKIAPNEAQAREIRAGFIRTLLLTEPYRSRALPHGIKILGACITDSLTLTQTRLIQPLPYWDQ